MTPGKLPGIPVAFYNRLHFATAAQQQKESRSHCWRSVGGRWAVKFPDNTVPIISKIDFICVKLDLSKSTVAKLLSAALDALEVPDAAASMPGGV